MKLNLLQRSAVADAHNLLSLLTHVEMMPDDYLDRLSDELTALTLEMKGEGQADAVSICAAIQTAIMNARKEG